MLPNLIKATLNLNNSTIQEELIMSNLNIISRKDICKEIGVSRDTLKKWIKERDFPEPLKSSGREPLFDRVLVKNWLLDEGGENE
jgi:predicted DNA-binding transcriptional regulator AlpA